MSSFLGGTWLTDTLWNTGGSAVPIPGVPSSGNVSRNVRKLRWYGLLNQPYVNNGRRGADNLRARAGEWDWSEDGDNVEKLRTIPISIPFPTVLSATPYGIETINVSWSENFDDFDQVKVWRKSDTEPYAVIATVAKGVKFLQDIDLDPSKVYTYKAIYSMLGFDGVNYSNEASAQPYAFAGPTDLLATPMSSTRIDLAWSDDAVGEAGWAVYRKRPADAEFALIATTAANAVSYSDTAVPLPETKYEYRVKAVSPGLIGEWSNVAIATSLPVFVLMDPLQLYVNGATDLGGNQFRLTRDGSGGQYGSVCSKIGAPQFKLSLASRMMLVVDFAFTDPAVNGHGISDSISFGFTTDPIVTGIGSPVSNLASMGDVFAGAEVEYNAGAPRMRFGIKKLRYGGMELTGAWVSMPGLFDGAWHNIRIIWNPDSDGFEVYVDGALKIEVDFDYQAHVLSYTSQTKVGLVFGCGSNLYFQTNGSQTTIRDPAFDGIVV